MKEQIALLDEKYHILNSFSSKEKEFIDHPPIKETKIFNSYAWDMNVVQYFFGHFHCWN